MLQAPDYAEALMAVGGGLWLERSYEERVNRVMFRLEWRQRVLSDSLMRLHLIITDDALAAEVGGREMMRLQLEHVLLIIDEHPNTSVPVLGCNNVKQPCAKQWSVSLMQFGEGQSASWVFVNVVDVPSRVHYGSPELVSIASQGGFVGR